jgi:hypothetical protein
VADAPRFKFYWERVEGTSVLTMRRVDWDTVIGLPVHPVIFDVSSTPLSHTSSVVASVAHQYGPANANIKIYRYDEKDAPYVINQDQYHVWTDLSSHPRLPEMITKASTEYNDNFKTYVEQNVFLVKKEAGQDHWLTTLPSSLSLIMKSS